jgi:hypothetical protein
VGVCACVDLMPTLNAQAHLWGVDDTLKTPHSYAVEFSIGREAAQPILTAVWRTSAALAAI